MRFAPRLRRAHFRRITAGSVAIVAATAIAAAPSMAAAAPAAGSSSSSTEPRNPLEGEGSSSPMVAPGIPATPSSTPDPQIIGGTIDYAPGRPYMAFLEVEGPDGLYYHCGGALISPRKLLTAAHCVDGMDFTTKGVAVFGSSDVTADNATQVVFPTEQWVHPQYDPETLRNDIAVLTMSSPLPFQTLPIAGPGDAALYTPGNTGTVLGWGVNDPVAQTSDYRLRNATLPLVADSTCATAMDMPTNGTMFCAGTGTGTVTPCYGDSGGPLIVNGKLVGVVSWGREGCAVSGAYAVFSKVSTYAADINTQVALWPATKPDHNRDGVPDVYARLADGRLQSFNGYGTYGFRYANEIGWGWNMHKSMHAPGDLDGDGRGDVLGMTPAGTLFSYQGKDNGYLGQGKNIGWGWTMFDAIMTPGDINGDRKPDLLGRTPAGTLFFYPGKGGGAVGEGVKIGWGWNMFNTIMTPGDIDGDKVPDLLGRTPAGTLFYYAGKGGGTFGEGVKIGTGWNMFNMLVGVGDLDRNGYADLAGRRDDGSLYLYWGIGNGRFGTPTRTTDYNWNQYTGIF